MPNTVTQRTLYGSGSMKTIVRSINIVSDGSEESDLVIFDNSAFCNNVAKGRVMKISASGSDCTCTIEWDQTTDSPIANFNPANNTPLCFHKFGGITNPNGTGATGDILLTTTGLDSGDVVTIFITVDQN